MHEDIYRMLHDKAVMFIEEYIEEYKKAGHEPPKEMLLIWEYEHEKLVKEFAEARFLIEEYHKSY